MKYLVAIFGVFILVILSVVLLTRDNKKDDKSKDAPKTVVLSDYKNNSAASAEYVIEGPINAPELHQTIRIWITPKSRNIEILKGYRGEVLKSSVFTNDTDSFGAFLNALNGASFTAKRETSSKYEGICPTGNRSRYILSDNGDNVVDSWSGSCAKGDYGGTVGLTTQLFQAQIPDYSKITSGTTVSPSGASSTGLVL